MVFISLPNSGTLFFNLNPNNTTLHSLKQTLHQHTSIPISLQHLIISSHNFHNDDSALLSQLGITYYSTLTLHVPVLGGTATNAPPPPLPRKPHLDFLNSKPPANYVAGLGRGATGFTTRSDIGPARAAPNLPNQSATTIGGVASLAAAVGRGQRKHRDDDGNDNDEGDEKGYDENQKFDEFEGNDVGLFANSEYDEDDKEADAIWEAIDEGMDSRRKDRREAKLK
ncbi:hypothetical protein Q3G72_013950 [Acer saccharum]|nr:hypothetical protein Q3G72_013950 [Acer saccharum]